MAIALVITALLFLLIGIIFVLGLLLISGIEVRIFVDLKANPVIKITATLLHGILGIRLGPDVRFEKYYLLIMGRSILGRNLRKKATNPPSLSNFIRGLSHNQKISGSGVQFLRSFSKAVKIVDSGGKLRVGSDDPYNIGIILGFYNSLSRMISPSMESLKFRMEPIFNEDVLEVSVHLVLRISMIRLISPSIRLYRSLR